MSITSSAGNVDVPARAVGGIAWEKVVVPALGVGVVGAIVGVFLRLGLGELVGPALRLDWVQHASKVGVVPAIILLLGGAGYGAYRSLRKGS